MPLGYITQVHRKLRPGLSAGHCDTFVATARLKGAGRTLPVYYKVFSLARSDKGIFNELFGYYLAKACGLPVPEFTFLCACPRTKLLGPLRCLQDRSPGDPYVAGIASLDANPHHVKQIVGDGPLLQADLLNWRHIATVAVFDELLCNIDRTRFNLIRIGEHEYAIIDHELILGGTSWTAEGLEVMLLNPSPANHLAELIASADDELVKRRMILTANDLISRVQLIPDIIEQDLESLCHLPSGTVDNLMRLLRVRINMIPDFLLEKLRVGQLFHDGT